MTTTPDEPQTNAASKVWSFLSNNNLMATLVSGLLIALVSGAAGFFYSNYTREHKELSYEIDGPINYLDERTIENITVEVDNQPVPRLIGYNIKVRNSGNTALKDLPVRIVFTSDDPDFKVLKLVPQSPSLTPIDPTLSLGDGATIDYRVDLLNKDESISITALINNSAQVEVFAKSENLELKEEKTDSDTDITDTVILIALLSIFITLTNLITMFLDYFGNRQNRRRRIASAESISGIVLDEDLPQRIK